MEISLEKIVKKIQWILNENNPALIGHSEKVAYIYMKLLEELNYSKTEILSLVTIATMHDIGAYKIVSGDNIEDVDLLKFDITNPHEHSVYGYLFIKNFGPKQLAKYANIVLYHHFKYVDFANIDKEYIDESQLLHLADRVTILMDIYKKIPYDILEEKADSEFRREYIELLKRVDKKHNLVKKIKKESYYKELYKELEKAIINNKYLDDILEMIVSMIDLKSEFTMYHNINVKSISRELALYSGYDMNEVKEIESAARIHDIGKILIPIEILEKDAALTKDEFVIMKKHIDYGRKILEEICDYDKMMLATTHHEKLDGTGYPDGLAEDEITPKQRILAVADITSALVGKRSYKDSFDKEKIVNILYEEGRRNKLDKKVVKILINNYDIIIEKANIDCKYALDKYNIFKMEYAAISNHLKKYNILK